MIILKEVLLFGPPYFGAWDFSVTNSVAYKSQIGNPVQNEPEEVGIKVFRSHPPS